MKHLYFTALIVAAIFLVSCSDIAQTNNKVYCEWEIIYPDTTIQYQDTLLFDREVDYVSVDSDRGTNYICINSSWHTSKSKCPDKSTCPIRIINYKILK